MKDRTEKFIELKDALLHQCPPPRAYVLVAIGEDGNLYWGAHYPTEMKDAEIIAEKLDHAKREMKKL